MVFRRTLLCTLACVFLGSSGCEIIATQVRDCRDYIHYVSKNKKLARQAWLEVCQAYMGTDCYEDFEDGFKKGYADLAYGRDGCPPVMPPRKYWKVKYRGEIGRVDAWFEGYRHGVAVAREDGFAGLSRIPTSVPPRPEPVIPHSAPTSDGLDHIPAPELDEPPAVPSASDDVPGPPPEKSEPTESKLQTAPPPAEDDDPFPAE